MFTEDVIQKVWNKANDVLNQNPNEVRMDKCGAIIWHKEYGNRNSKYGWEIDHIIPISKGGNDDITNLQALHWENNAAKGDGELCCKIAADENLQQNKVKLFWNIMYE